MLAATLNPRVNLTETVLSPIQWKFILPLIGLMFMILLGIPIILFASNAPPVALQNYAWVPAIIGIIFIIITTVKAR